MKIRRIGTLSRNVNEMIQLYAAEGIDNVAQNCTLFIRQNHNIALTEEVEMLRYLNI